MPELFSYRSIKEMRKYLLISNGYDGRVNDNPSFPKERS
jgi:hypothetical protein